MICVFIVMVNNKCLDLSSHYVGINSRYVQWWHFGMSSVHYHYNFKKKPNLSNIAVSRFSNASSSQYNMYHKCTIFTKTLINCRESVRYIFYLNGFLFVCS